MRRFLASLLLILALLPCVAAEWDLGPKRWEVTSDEAQIDEDTNAWMIDLALFPSSFWETANIPNSIRVTGLDADTEKPVHIIGFQDDGSTGSGWLRVNYPIATGIDSTVFVYAGDPAATMPAADSTYGSENAYDANIAAAWWFDGGSLVDSTANGHTLALNNSPTPTTGPVSGLSGYSFNGSSQSLRSSTVPIAGPPYTVMAWGNSDSATVRGTLLQAASTSTGINIINLTMAGDVASDPVRAALLGNGGSSSAAVTSTGYTVATWHHAAGTRTGTTTGTTAAYIDGGSAGTDSTTVNAFTSMNLLTIGAARSGGAENNYFDGVIGPVEIHNIARSAAYIATLTNMITAPGDVYTIGAMEAVPAASGDTGLLELTDVSASTGWANPLYALTDLGDAATDDVPAGGTTGALNLITLSGDLSALNGQPITGIAVEVTATGEDVSTRTLEDQTVRLIIGGTVVGDNKASGVQWVAAPLQTRVYGGEGDTWGVTPVYTDIQAANFGVSLAYINDGPSLDALMSVYRVRMQIWYGTGAAASSSSFFIMFD